MISPVWNKSSVFTCFSCFSWPGHLNGSRLNGPPIQCPQKNWIFMDPIFGSEAEEKCIVAENLFKSLLFWRLDD